jgi:hypothetical protein
MNILHQQSAIDNIDYETTECHDNLFDEEQQYEDEDDEIVAENERIPIGTRVKLHDKKIGRVIGNEINFHYAVDFGDGSYSHDMYVIIAIQKRTLINFSYF